MFPQIKYVIILLCLLSISYISFIILRLTNLKQIIAASSIIHIPIGIIALLFISNTYVFLSGILLLVHHSILSCILFLLAGEIKNITNSLDITLLKSINITNKNLTLFFYLAFLINISFPLTISFCIELFLFTGLLSENFFLFFILVLVNLFNTIYSFKIFSFINQSDNLTNISSIKIINIISNSTYLNILPLIILFFFYILIFIFFSLLIIYI